MTEAEWLVCTDPLAMLRFLHGRASERKLRLWMCACARRLWSQLADESDRRAVEVAERYADGATNRSELEQARRVIVNVRNLGARANELLDWRSPACLAWCATRKNTNTAARDASVAEIWYAGAWASSHSDIGWKMSGDPPAERVWQAHVLRDLFGDPFRTVAVDPLWLAWNDRTVPRLAQVIYDERAYDRLPILADALEEAGCTDADILNHCRQPGEHVRGCWVLDALLGKS